MAIVRAGLTQTVNAYRGMPDRVEDLPRLAGELDAVRQANLDHHAELILAAKQRGVQVLGLGELFTAPYFALQREPMWRALAEDATNGPTVTFLRRRAAESQMVLIAPIYELEPRSGKRFNTAVVIDARGEVLGGYRKTHIPEGRNEQAAFSETFYYERSDGQANTGRSGLGQNPFFPVFATDCGKIGVAICYDRHFEGVMAALARGGAEIVFSPAVTFGAQSQRLWPLEFQVDAARHRLFIGGSNRQGREPPWNQPYFGQSLFCGPGGLLADRSDHPALVIADLDLATLRQSDPSGWNLARDARPEIYRP